MSRKCFVIMPFGIERLNEFYYATVAPAVESAGYKCCRVDDVLHGTYQITREVVRHIEEADIVLADLTSLNPNVFYELGVAHSFGTNVLMLAEQGQKLPFDLKDHKVFFYSTDKEERGSLEDFLINSLSRLSWTKSPNNPVQLYSNRLKRLLNFTALDSEITDNSDVALELYKLLKNSPSIFADSPGPVEHVVAIGGGVSTGKTTFSHQLKQQIETIEGEGSASVLSLDAYQLPRSELLKKDIDNGFCDESWNIKDAAADTEKLTNAGGEIKVHDYDHRSGRHFSEFTIIKPARYVILDGLIAFHQSLLKYSDYKVFIGGERLRHEQNLRIKAAYHQRGYSLRQAMRKSEDEIKAFRAYYLVKRKYADIFIDIENERWKFRVNPDQFPL